MNEHAADVLFYGLLLLLPLAALIARRPPLGRTLKMALAWIAIFLVGLVVVSQRDRLPEFSGAMSSESGTGSGTRISQASGGQIAIEGTYVDPRVSISHLHNVYYRIY